MYHLKGSNVIMTRIQKNLEKFNMPLSKIHEWLKKEKQLGSTDPDRMVLATASAAGKVHSRIVAIREISEAGVLFFTQRATRKVADMTENASASMTLWLPLQQREVILDGVIKALTYEENLFYWDTLPYERQVKFTLHSSGRQLSSVMELDDKYKVLLNTYRNQKVPMNDAYCGFRLCPEMMYFYTLGMEKFSEVIKYLRTESGWESQLISP